MNTAGAGTRRLLVALAAGLALLVALVALQLVDESDRPSASDAPVQVQGIEVSRASLAGTVTGADGWRVEVTVTVGGDQRTVVASADGRYRVRNLLAGLAEVTWVAENSATAAGGITLGGQRTGRTQVTLVAGPNTLDVAL